MKDKSIQELLVEGDEPIKVEIKDGCESLSDEKLTLCWWDIELPVYACKKCFDGINKKVDGR